MMLAFGGLFGLAQAYAFDLVVTSLGGGGIAEFTYLINEDNTGNPFDPDPNKHPGVKPMASHSPIVAAGREDTASGINLPNGRYLVSVRAEGHKLWGRHIRIANGTVFDADGNNLGGSVTIELRPTPLPLSTLQVLVFEDFHQPNGFPDFPNEVNANGSVTNMAGFHIVLSDGTGQVVVDWFGKPICGTGRCLTDARGKVTIPNLPHGKFQITVDSPQQLGLGSRRPPSRARNRSMPGSRRAAMASAPPASCCANPECKPPISLVLSTQPVGTPWLAVGGRLRGRSKTW